MAKTIFVFDSSSPENVRALRQLNHFKETMSVIDAAQDADDPNRLVITLGEPAAPARSFRAKKVAPKKSKKKG